MTSCLLGVDKHNTNNDNDNNNNDNEASVHTITQQPLMMKIYRLPFPRSSE